MIGYMHTFRAGMVPGIGAGETVLFYTHGETCTRHAAERIARGMSEFCAMPLTPDSVDYIKHGLVRLDSVEETARYGMHSYSGSHCGGAVRHIYRCK